jgi:hypothetical protein
MKQNFYNPKLAEKEKKKKEQELSEAQVKKEYFARLKTDTLFQKYIMEEILEKEIRANKEIGSDFTKLLGSSPEQIKDIILAKSAALKACEVIKSKILRNT